MRTDTPLARLAAAMNIVGTALVLLIMIVMLVDILGRFLMKTPLNGTPEIVAMSISAIVFLQMPSTLRAGRVIGTDGFLNWVGAKSVRVEQWLQALYHLIGAGMFAILSSFVMPLAIGVWESGERYGNIGVFTFPKWPIFFAITLGAIVMTAQYFTLAAGYFGAGLARRRLIAIDPATRVLS